jgi:hypothetical protein
LVQKHHGVQTREVSRITPLDGNLKEASNDFDFSEN